VTLIVALRTEDGKIIIGADGLVYVNDQANNLNPTFPTNKLLSVRRTDWKLAYAGSNVVEAFSKRIEAEVELGQRSPFDPHLEIGGPAYLNALNILASEAERAAPDRKMPTTTVLLAGFDIDKNPYLLQSQLPHGGYFTPPGGYAVLGVQDAIVWWLLLALGPCCETNEAAENSFRLRSGKPQSTI
jgi:hypothetical protein